MSFRSSLLALTMLAAPAIALAQPVSGPYISLGIGANYLQSQTVKTEKGNSNQLNTDVGYVGVPAAGWGFGNGFRAELQGDYRSNNLTNGIGGKIEQFGGFVNGYYDFDLTGTSYAAFTPYVGLGGGYEINHFNNLLGIGVEGAVERSTGSKGDYAVQGMLGFAYDITAVPGLALTAEYRFTGEPSDLEHNGQRFSGHKAYANSLTTDGAYNHAGIIGLRYALWAPAPAPAPEAAVAPVAPPMVTEAKTYLVFFDWDRADLSPRAREIVATAAAASTHVQTTKIEVNGYTDLSGTAAYNQKLSVRRAQSVEAELVKDGVAQAEIDIHGYGESNPLVPTAKGVREPQNRRVEIILK
jgi:outer membrane protein OmpA-like peptidoglycan-associated protein